MELSDVSRALSRASRRRNGFVPFEMTVPAGTTTRSCLVSIVGPNNSYVTAAFSSVQHNENVNDPSRCE